MEQQYPVKKKTKKTIDPHTNQTVLRYLDEVNEFICSFIESLFLFSGHLP